jgi:type VI secretion system protein ImpJ
VSKRVIWSEGMFLRPQHFQQQDRYLERCIEQRSAGLRPCSWGFTELELQRELLADGKIGVRRAAGVFPDGTPFSIPDDDPAPPVLELPAGARDRTVYLALPLRKDNATEFMRARTGSFARFAYSELPVRDVAADGASKVPIAVGDLASLLVLEGEPIADFACIPLARVIERRADRTVLLDAGFMPTVLRIGCAEVLAAFVRDLHGMLRLRADRLAKTATGSDMSGAAGIGDYLFLQLCNRYEPLVDHWANSLALHPEDFYAFVVSLAGELATFTDEKTRRAPSFQPYEHARLRESFDPVMEALNEALHKIIAARAEPITLQARTDLAIWHGVVADRSLIDSATFVLGVHADVPDAQLSRYFPDQAKIAEVEQIRFYIRGQERGVPLKALQQPPRQIPFHSGFIYFELDTRSPAWKELRGSGAIAIHVGGQYPGLGLELWAIRG